MYGYIYPAYNGCNNGYNNNSYGASWIWIIVVIFILFFLFWGFGNNNGNYNNNYH